MRFGYRLALVTIKYFCHELFSTEFDTGERL